MPSRQLRINIVDLKVFIKEFFIEPAKCKQGFAYKKKLNKLMLIKVGNPQAQLAWLDFHELWTRGLGRFEQQHGHPILPE